jgi:hypothetical protein
MWRPEFSDGAVALARIPLASFGDGSRDAPNARYRFLPRPKGDAYSFHDRFVGDYVLYGSGKGWGASRDGDNDLIAAPVRGGPVARLTMSHGVDRIEALGRVAIVVGGDEQNLYFTAVELTTGPIARLGDRYALPMASEGETRSHGFFFSPDAGVPQDTARGAQGVLGLPVARAARPGFEQLFQTSAAMTFRRRQDRRFRPLGERPAHDEGAVDDGCVAAFVDWYGNARPIFLRGRVFALLGYELVEGVERPGAIREVGRVDFAPREKPAAR